MALERRACPDRLAELGAFYANIRQRSQSVEFHFRENDPRVAVIEKQFKKVQIAPGYVSFDLKTPEDVNVLLTLAKEGEPGGPRRQQIRHQARRGLRYWWVSQTRGFELELEGGYLWAPTNDRRGNSVYHWETLGEVCRDDVIFSYCHQAVAAVLVATSDGHPSLEPPEKVDVGEGAMSGWRVDAD